MLFYDAPEWHKIALLRASHDFLEKAFCLETRDKCLKCFSSLGEQCAITRIRCWRVVGTVKQRSLSNHPLIQPCAQSVHDTICNTHTALHGWPAYFAST